VTPGVVPASSATEAAELLEAGEVVAVPTDTVYGLVASVRHPMGPARLFAVKDRPRQVELPVLVADAGQASSLVASFSGAAQRLAGLYWPGALTLVMGRRPGFSVDLGGDGSTVGVRCPAHPVPLALCGRVGPLASTSANLHGRSTPATAEGVAEVFGDRVALVLDGGAREGAPSTVVDCTGEEPRCLREGAIPWSSLLRALEGDE
jgi:L-threonylcarbamoyladenylate synthase